MLNVHLITTDATCFSVVDKFRHDINISCLIIPENRLGSDKIIELYDHAKSRGVPVCVHKRGSPFDQSIPPASAAISWLYSQIIQANDIFRYKCGVINMHGGKMPEYRGASVLHWAIINGEDELGVTWHDMVEEVDAGAIRAEALLPISRDSTAWDVRQQLVDVGTELFPEAWKNLLDGRCVRTPDLSMGRVWPQRKPEDSRIEPGWTERQVRDMVRAMCPPWPPAFVETSLGHVGVQAVTTTPESNSIPYETAEGVTLYLMTAKSTEL